MSIAKIIEISSSSPVSFEAAIRDGIARAAETINNIQGAWVSEQKVRVENGKLVEFRVALRITFLLESLKSDNN